MLGQRIEFTRLGRMVQAVIIFAYSLSVGTVDWSFSRIVVLIFMLLGGTALFAGIFLIYAAICFFTLEGLEFMNVLTDGARAVSYTPLFCRHFLPFFPGRNGTVLFSGWLKH